MIHKSLAYYSTINLYYSIFSIIHDCMYYIHSFVMITLFIICHCQPTTANYSYPILSYPRYPILALSVICMISHLTSKPMTLMYSLSCLLLVNYHGRHINTIIQVCMALYYVYAMPITAGYYAVILLPVFHYLVAGVTIIVDPHLQNYHNSNSSNKISNSKLLWALGISINSCHLEPRPLMRLP